ncbi:CAF17-like 4Fe-4S cluster assembly/insertion protein YgfZ [Wohlfahrtiimonas populi]|uniref:CAF17-like 4Fe-4S cluster assembly/insertion protein YgfZ n=1 Tax=Wohlfahrtiimonas populi TaxID=1940240 RepID=UPI00098D5334|nr:folate-binding protein YgfZ [Wohlfahrtiimonas populi]
MMDFAKLVVTGADARNFLHGQLTADMDHLDYLYDHPENSGLGGLCNIKGRLEAVFWIQKIENGFDLYLPKCISESIATLLKRFVFRSKVTIEIVDANDEFATVVPQDFNIPWIIEATQGKYVPQMVSLDVLKGVHPRKGCYIGQEIVTRLRDLGKNKKRLGKISLGQNSNINIGDTIHTDNDVVAGEIVLVQENEALAVLVLAELHQTLKLSDNIELLNVWKDDNE